jgi:hypothetical protein
MKKLAVGIMICSVSAAFAQTDRQGGISNDRLKVKKEMQRMSEVALVDQPTISAKSRETEKSSEVTGVIRIKNGTPFIDLSTSNVKRRMFAVNLPKSAAIEGQKIRFTYIIETAGQPTGAQCDHVIRIYDVASVKK